MKRRIAGIVLLIAGLVFLVVGAAVFLKDRAREQPAPARAQARPGAPQPAEIAPITEPEADPVVALAARYQQADIVGRKAIMPEVIQVLKTYGKNWQGSDERQLLYESGYLELASAVKPDVPEGDDAKLIADVEEKTTLRVKYLADASALKTDVDRARELLLAKQYAPCKDFCELIVSGCYGRLPGVELALGMCYDALGDVNASQHKFLEVIELCHEADPEKAAAAAFLAGRGMLSGADYENALKMFKAVQEDYPNSPYAAKSREFSLRMEAALHKTQDTPVDTAKQ